MGVTQPCALYCSHLVSTTCEVQLVVIEYGDSVGRYSGISVHAEEWFAQQSQDPEFVEVLLVSSRHNARSWGTALCLDGVVYGIVGFFVSVCM